VSEFADLSEFPALPTEGLGFKVQGVGFRGFRVQGSGCRVQRV